MYIYDYVCICILLLGICIFLYICIYIYIAKVVYATVEPDRAHITSALQLLDKALVGDPQHKQGTILKGEIHMERAQYAEALVCIQTAVQGHGTDIALKVKLGKVR